MKKTILTALAMVCAAGAFAQGTVIFNNRNGITTHVYSGGNSQIRGNSAADNPSGSTVYPGLLIGTAGGLAAGTTFASLLGAAGTVPEGSPLLLAASGGGVTTFRTGAAAGNIVATTATFNNIPKDAPTGTFQMVAWDNSSGLYSNWTLASQAWQAGLIAAGSSALFTFNLIGGDVNTPPIWGNAIGVSSFNIYTIPEPSTMALAGLGAAALVIFRRRK